MSFTLQALMGIGTKEDNWILNSWDIYFHMLLGHASTCGSKNIKNKVTRTNTTSRANVAIFPGSH